MRKMQADDTTYANEYMTRQDVAKYLNISLRSVDRLIHSRDFIGVQKFGRLVRIHKPSLDKYLATRCE